MEPTLVRIGVMDSRRPQEVVALPARHLHPLERLARGLKRMVTIVGVGLLVGNFLLVVIPFPAVHLCLIPVALIVGPIFGVATWKDRVLLAAQSIECPRCGGAAEVPAELPGWPARFNCERCAIMVEINAAAPVGNPSP